jgi:hypothetical protein
LYIFYTLTVASEEEEAGGNLTWCLVAVAFGGFYLREPFIEGSWLWMVSVEATVFVVM